MAKHWITFQKSQLHALIAIWLGEAFDAMDATIYYIVLVPALGDLLHTTDYARIGLYGSLILVCFMVGWAMGAVFFGVIADRFGRVKALMWSIILYAVACGLCATSHNWVELAIYRFFVGLGIGGEINVGIIYLAESWQPKDRSWAISLSQTSFPAGMLIVSVFTYILGIFGWRWLFLVGIIPAFLTLYIRRSLSETKSTNNDSNTKLNNIPIKTQSEPTETVFSRDNILKLLLTTGLGTCAIVGYWAAVAWIPSWIDQISHVNAVDQKSAATFWMSMGGIAGCFFTPLLVRYFGMSNALKISFLGILVLVVSMFLSFKTYSPLILLLCLVEGFIGTQVFNLLSIWAPMVFSPNVRGIASGITWGTGRFIAASTILCSTQLMSVFHGSYALTAACIAGACYLPGILLASFVKEQLTYSINKQRTTLAIPNI